jgi:hypothetical protein
MEVKRRYFIWTRFPKNDDKGNIELTRPMGLKALYIHLSKTEKETISYYPIISVSAYEFKGFEGEEVKLRAMDSLNQDTSISIEMFKHIVGL